MPSAIHGRYLAPAAAAVVVAVTAGCGPKIPEPDACDAPDARGARAVQVGQGSLDSVFEPWEDGDPADIVFGPQGDAMIAARYRVEADELACISQRTRLTDGDGGVWVDNRTPLRVYRQDDGAYLTETHWLIFEYGAGPVADAEVLVVDVEVGSATAFVELSLDDRGGG